MHINSEWTWWSMVSLISQGIISAAVAWWCHSLAASDCSSRTRVSDTPIDDTTGIEQSAVVGWTMFDG